MVAAFVLGGFHWTCGGGSKILLLEARLLPLSLAGFIGSVAEAAKSCFQGAVAAFAFGGFHGTCGGGSKFHVFPG